jgi:hypothetical protein
VVPDIDYRRDGNKKLVFDENGRPIPVGGVTIAYAEQVVALSLPALRRLHFPLDGKVTQEVNAAGRTVLAALGLCAAALAGEKGFDLRSRCLLWPSGPMDWELLEEPGKPPARMTLKADAAIALLKDAVAAAEVSVGLALVLSLYQRFKTLNADAASTMRALLEAQRVMRESRTDHPAREWPPRGRAGLQ